LVLFLNIEEYTVKKRTSEENKIIKQNKINKPIKCLMVHGPGKVSAWEMAYSGKLIVSPPTNTHAHSICTKSGEQLLLT